MFQAQRHEKIVSILNRKKSASIETLCKELYCSPATLRRDLVLLEREGLITRRRGGAAARAGASSEYSYTFRDTKRKEEKAYICSIAETFLQNGLSVFLDSSSTVFTICDSLHKYKGLSVVTNCIATAYRLAQTAQEGDIEVHVAGGRMKSGSASTIGEFASGFIQNYQADVALLSCRGITEQGAFEASQEQALVKQQMIKNAKTVLLLCDSGKFNNSYFYRLSDLNKIEAVITEKEPSKEFMEAAAAAGCEVLF